MSKQIYRGADIFDGTELHTGKAFVQSNGGFVGIIPEAEAPNGAQVVSLDGGTIMPGFIDLQVNGGGGVMLNDDTTATGVAAIAQAHATTGTAALLPTLITDTYEKTKAAIDAVATAIEQGVSGVIGIHIEGPHLSVARKGAHDPALIRPMDANDEALLIDAARRLPNVLVTVAPENVTTAQIARLAAAGIIVSLGHTDCSMDTAQAAFAAGAKCATHLFNAMSQLGNREPGLVGAVFNSGPVFAGLIADGIHVHKGSIAAALAAKSGEGQIFLVTDAMSTVGSDITSFALNGRKVLRRDNRLTLEDGTLAGADLTFSKALSVMVDDVGVPRQKAFAMATSYPANLLQDTQGFGTFTAGQPSHAIHLGDDFTLLRHL